MKHPVSYPVGTRIFSSTGQHAFRDPGPHAARSANVYAQEFNGTYLKDLIEGLNSANFTALAGAFQSISSTAEGSALLAKLPAPPGYGRKSLLAPTNEAFAAVTEDVSRNATLMANILSYHVMSGSNFPEGINAAPGQTIMPTYYWSETLPTVLWEGENRGRVSEGREGVCIYRGGRRRGSEGVFAIDKVLALPGNVGDVVKAHTPVLSNVMEKAAILPQLTGAAGDRYSAVAAGITLFAPDDAAWQNATDWQNALSEDQLRTVLANHLIMWVLPTNLFPGNHSSGAGQNLRLSYNDTGYYVSTGGTTAKIVKKNVPLANGIMHVIDRVLTNTEGTATALFPTATSTSNALATGKVSSALAVSSVSAGTVAWALAVAAGFAVSGVSL